MHISFSIDNRRWLAIGFVVAFLAATVVASAAYGELRRYQYWDLWVLNAQAVLGNLETQQGEVIEALTELDRYRHSSDIQQLNKLPLISAKLQGLSTTLRILTRDNPAQQARLDKVDSILHLLPSLLGQWINATQATESVQPSWSPDLTSVLYQLLTSYRQMSIEGNRLLSVRLASARIASRESVIIIATGGALIFAWLLFVTGYAGLNVQRNREMAQALAESQEQLLRAAERRKADEQFRRLIESAQDAMVIIGKRGRIILANAQAEKLYGYARSELVGMKAEMLSPERLRIQYREDPRLRAAGSGMEFYGCRKDSTEFPVEVSVGPVELEDGTIICMAVRDITLRKKMEQELRESDERYRLLVQNLQGYAIFMLDPEGHVLSWSDSAQRMKGYSAEEIIGRDFSCFYPEEDVANGKPAHILTMAQETGRCEDQGWRVRKDGSRFWADLVITALYGADGKLQGFSKIVRDITDRKQAEEKFRGLLESAPDAMVIVGKDGRIQLVNAQTETLFGYSREELLGQPVELLVPDRFRQRHPDHREGYFSSPKVRAMGAGMDLTARRKDASEFAAEISLSPIPTAEGILVTAAIRDISERKRLEEEQRRRIIEASRLKSEFLANMSHELRTPLNAIIGFAALIHSRKAGPLNENQTDYLQDILTSARHLLHLINDVLDLAKIEAGKMEFHSEPLSLPTTVSELIDTLRALASEKHIRIIADCSPAVTTVTLDPAKLKQVLYNYLSNAIKFTPVKGTVTVRTLPEGEDYFRVEVEDTGIGIAPEDLHRLFVEFQQLDATPTKKYGGTGLGLSLTKRIVEAQSGSVSVQSALGKGSIFVAILPRAMPGSAEPSQPFILRHSAPGRPILVIEDDRGDRDWLVHTLTDAGYPVEAAGTGAEAIRLCNTKPFAAITLDLLLPDASGWEVLREIRATPLNRQVPAIVVTASRDQGLRGAFVFQDYLVKPVEDHVLLDALKRAGMHPGNGAVLLIDNDLASLELVSAHLSQFGYRTVCRTTPEEALELIQKDPPALIILELLLEGMNGFQFLDELRCSTEGRLIPVIVWTAKDLSNHERRQLRDSAQAIVPRTDAGDLLDKLRLFLTSISNGSEGAAV